MFETQRQAEEYHRFIVEIRESFRYVLIGSCCHGEGGGGLTRSKASSVIGYRSIFSFLHLVLSWKRQKLRKLVVD